MTVLFMTDDLSQIGGITTVTTAGSFDPDYATESMFAVDNVSFAVDFPAGATDEVWFHFDLQYDANSNDNGDFFIMSDVNGVGLANIDFTGNRMRVEMGGFGTSFLFGAALRTVDIMYKADGTNRTTTMYVDGAILSTRTTASTNLQLPRQVDLGGNDRGDLFYSQFVISDTPLVGRKVGFVRPNAAGADADWTGGFAELGDTNIASIAFADAVGERVSSIPSAWTGLTTGTIERVVPIGIGAATGAGPQSVAHYLKIAGTNYDSTPSPMGAVPDFFVSEYALNPDTGAIWTFADLAALEMGLLAGT